VRIVRRGALARGVRIGLETARRVTRQVPAVAARRLKAYADTARERAAPNDPHADIEV